jgi:DNA-binding NarL/FixJ family response regulator
MTSRVPEEGLTALPHRVDLAVDRDRQALINILIVDDHALVRKGIRATLQAETDFSVLAEAGSYAEAIEALRLHSLHAVIADIAVGGPVPGRDSIDLIGHVRSVQPQARFIVLTMHTENAYASRALKAGAHGYITKNISPEILVSAVRRVMTGAPFLSPNVAESLALTVARQDKAAVAHSRLSKRELTVFELLAHGKTIDDIANQLALSAKTVRTHKMNVLRKMNLHTAADLVRYAVEHEVICPW